MKKKDITIPKFDTIEELEEFTKGVLLSVDALKIAIDERDDTITRLAGIGREHLTLMEEKKILHNELERARKENKRLAEACENKNYKDLYEKERARVEDLHSNHEQEMKEYRRQKDELHNNLIEHINKRNEKINFLYSQLSYFGKKRFCRKFNLVFDKDRIFS